MLSGRCTTGQHESVLCKLFAQMRQLLVANHTVLLLLLTSVFYVLTAAAAGGIQLWKSMVLCNHSMQP